MTAAVDQFKKLLDEFKKLPQTPQRDPTTLELSGYPHLENVYSNILAFFLDPGREHGFRSLFLNSLLSVAKYEEIQDSEEVEVNREEITETRKRIDLVISTDTLIIGIENKIKGKLYNDLEDYGRRLTKQAQVNERRVCKILLGLNSPNDDNELFGFKPITYQEYFGEILKRIGPILIGSNDRYLRFALEVIETIKHLPEGSAMKPEMLDFFKNKKKQKAVETLMQEVHNLKKDMKKRVTALWDILDISGQRPIEVKSTGKGQLFNYSLYHYITIEDDFVLVINAYISPEGWNVEIEGDFQRIKNWLDTQKVDYEPWPEHNACGLKLPRLP